MFFFGIKKKLMLLNMWDNINPGDNTINVQSKYTNVSKFCRDILLYIIFFTLIMYVIYLCTVLYISPIIIRQHMFDMVHSDQSLDVESYTNFNFLVEKHKSQIR